MQLKNFVVAFALAAVVHLKDISGISTYHAHTHTIIVFQMYTLRYHFTFFLFVWLFVYFIFAIAIDFSICLCSSLCYVNMNDSMVFFFWSVCHFTIQLSCWNVYVFCFVVFFFSSEILQTHKVLVTLPLLIFSKSIFSHSLCCCFFFKQCA